MPRVKQGDDAKLPLSSRVSPEFMALLQAAAKQAGRSVSREVEARLLASFASDKPSLTAEDVRQIVREEMGQEATAKSAHYVGMGLWLDENDKPIFDPDAPLPL